MKTKNYLFFSLFVLFTCTLKAQQKPVSAIAIKLETQIRKVIHETGIPSISYAIFNSDSLMYKNALGYSNVSLKIPATDRTIYNTGSTFKAITAMSMMQLHASNRLDIDFPIANYLHKSSFTDLDSDYPVTLRHLLSHRSGLRGEVNKIPLWSKALPNPLDSLLIGIKAFQKPGTEFKYCNHCYGIAGLILQNITKQTFGEYVTENLLEPLSIKQIDLFTPTAEMVETMALPYNKENNKPVPEDYYRYDVYPAGDAWLTPSNMAKLLSIQLNNGNYNGISILDSGFVEEMQTNQFTSNNYGLGIGVTATPHGKLLMHGGSIPGFSSYFILDTNIKKGIYIMANCSDSGNILLALSEYATQLLQGLSAPNDLPDFSKQVYNEISLGTGALIKYTGKYELAPEMFIQVFMEGKNLFIQVTGQSKVQIYPYEEHKFFLKVTDAQITFNKNTNGLIEGLTLFQKGKSINGVKIIE